MTKINHNTLPVPLYYQIIEKIKSLMIQESFKVDDKFYSERVLAKRFDVARITVNRAFEELVKEKVLYKKSGKDGRGTFIGKALSSNIPNVLTLGFVVHDSSMNSSFNARMLLELQIAAEQNGHSLYFFNEEVQKLQYFVDSRKIDCLVVTGEVDDMLVSHLKMLTVPFVIVGNYDLVDKEVNIIQYGLHDSVYQAVESVIDKADKIALLGCGTGKEASNINIEAGIKSAMQVSGLKENKLILEFSSKLDGFCYAAKLLDNSAGQPSVLVVAETLFPGVAKYLLINSRNITNKPIIIVVGSSYLDSEFADLIDICVADIFPETGKHVISQVEKVMQQGNETFFSDCIKLKVKFNIKK